MARDPSLTDTRTAMPSIRRIRGLLYRYPVIRQGSFYGASVAGVAAVTWLISLVFPRYHVANISMVYLLLVLALAVLAGSGPAILASVLSFLAFDWFFIPPVGHITVSDPDEWLALFLFLVTVIITGQLAAGLRRRAAEAHRREREVSTLYELSMAILGDTQLDHVLQVIAVRLRTTLELRAAAILLTGADGSLEVATQAGEALSDAEREDLNAGALWAIESGAMTGRFLTQGALRVTRPLTDERDSPSMDHLQLLGTYAPIALGEECLGAVAAVSRPGAGMLGEERRRLLNAFVAQTALAIGRARYAREEERARAAAASERMKSIFLASVSHDLRTPLTAIKTAAAALRSEGGLHSAVAQRELTDSIDQEAERLNRLVENLLEMSRIEVGGLPLRREPEDIAEIVGTAAHQLASLLAERTLRVDIPDDLPLIPLDVVQMDRVLANLLENAAKFSPPRSEITIRAWRAAAQVCVSVHNLGPFIPEGERERIFDKFYRLTPGSADDRGTGLGLAICRGIVEAHGGSIRAENDRDGPSFIFCLPFTLNAGPQVLSSPAVAPVSA